MEHPTITLEGRDYVIVPKGEYEKLSGRASTAAGLPPLPRADRAGNRPAIAFARATIARTLIGRMTAAGLSQAQLARLSGVPAATLNRIFKATRTADERTVLKIERALTKAAQTA